VIVDVCTGSGCIAVSLAKDLPASRIFATDRSGRALAVARENARKHAVGGQIRFLEGDLFRPLDELDLAGKIHVITANPPYIELKDLGLLQPEVRDFEPEIALISGPEGTEIHQRIIADASRFLAKNGALIMEMGIGQSEKLAAMSEATGSFGIPEILKDLAGIDRVIKLQRKQEPRSGG
jgi:release factor glutamine methyltransferase